MASATTSRTLPKSNFHQSTIASASATGDIPISASVPPEDSVGEAQKREKEAELAWQSTDVSHPDHVIPPRSYNGIEDLVIVCCHAIYHPDASSPSFPLQGPHVESNWHLAPFQASNPETGKLGEHETFLSHISAGVDALTLGPSADNSLLVFSGGVTKSSLTNLSEARSYYHAALGFALSQGFYNGGRPRELYDKGLVLLEENATDSFQNLLFSILLFRRTTGFYPKQIRIITHAFKSKRFLDLHAPAIKWPRDKIKVHGIDPIMSGDEIDETLKGEERYGYAAWTDDALGTGELLTRKREQRGWDGSRVEELGDGLEESVKLLLKGTVAEDLPWSENIASPEDSVMD
jgi:hypothetical protein